MYWQMLMKELLIIWRRPRELIVLLLMPFILITILGSALGAMNDGDIQIDAKLAVVVKDKEDTARQKVIEEVSNSNLDRQQREGIIATIQSIQPVDLFLNNVVKSPELQEILSVKVYTDDISEKEAEKYDGVLIIPNGFTEAFYRYLSDEKDSVPAWDLRTTDEGSVNSSITQDVISSYQKEWVYIKTAKDVNIDYSKLTMKSSMNVESVTKKKEISAFSYYAVGMCVMFVFYVSTTVANFAFQQKEERIFERIILANVPSSLFFAGIFSATFLLSFIQLHILFGLTAVVYGVIFPSVSNYLVVTLFLNIMVAGFATFVSMLSFRTNSRNVESVFSSLVIPVLAFIGGSFFNLSSMGGVMEKLGEYSPGGAAVTAYLKIYQGYGITEIASQLQAISLFSLVLLIGSVLLMKKRGGVL